MSAGLFTVRGLLQATTWADRLLCMVLVAAALLTPGLARPGGDGPLRAVVTVDRNEVAVLGLDRDTETTVRGRLGDVRLVVRDHAIRVVAASCPQHVCIAAGAKGRSGELIACVPNRLLIRITGGPPPPRGTDVPDAVTR